MMFWLIWLRKCSACMSLWHILLADNHPSRGCIRADELLIHTLHSGQHPQERGKSTWALCPSSVLTSSFDPILLSTILQSSFILWSTPLLLHLFLSLSFSSAYTPPLSFFPLHFPTSPLLFVHTCSISPPHRFPHEGLGHAVRTGGLTWAGGMQGRRSQSCCCAASQSSSAAQCCRLMMQQDFWSSAYQLTTLCSLSP